MSRDLGRRQGIWAAALFADLVLAVELVGLRDEPGVGVAFALVVAVGILLVIYSPR